MLSGGEITYNCFSTAKLMKRFGMSKKNYNFVFFLLKNLHNNELFIIFVVLNKKGGVR